MSYRKIDRDEYRMRWDKKSKKLIKVSLKDLEYDKIRKEYLEELKNEIS